MQKLENIFDVEPHRNLHAALRPRTLFFTVALSLLISPSIRGQSACPTIPAEITGNVVLPKDCIGSQEFKITQSHTSLDCNGAVFDGHDVLKIGINIDSGGHPLEDVTVKNCTFQNYKGHGVLIGWSGWDSNKPADHDYDYSHTPRNVVIDHVTILNSMAVGLYVDDYAQHVTLDHLTVNGSRHGPGIYFEHSSRYITLRNSIVSNNGGSSREGLAIDSSSHDTVENDVFDNNTAGGVFLYKNCHEHASNPHSVVRWQHSDFNIIRGNLFRDEPVGIWIASRQSRDLGTWDCGDTPMGGDDRYYRDYADNNLVEGNTFCSVKVPIRVEGDNNTIKNNRFDAKEKTQVDFPKTKRETLLGLPQVGNHVTGSVTVSCSEATNGPEKK